jgi:hypothetical protein
MQKSFRPSEMVQRRQVISKPGAAVRVTELTLSKKANESLKTGSASFAAAVRKSATP